MDKERKAGTVQNLHRQVQLGLLLNLWQNTRLYHSDQSLKKKKKKFLVKPTKWQHNKSSLKQVISVALTQLLNAWPILWPKPG